jgi:cytoskeletal protein RodZ
MATFGQKLKEAREEKGLRLEDVSHATRVRACHLEALERDDFDAMPQDVFVRGFVRMYADCLEVDPDSLVAEYRRERDNQRPTWEEDTRNEVVQEMSRILKVPREVSAENTRRMFKLAGFIVVLLALAGVWWIGSGNRQEAQLARAELGASTPVSIEAAERPPAPKPRAAPVRSPPAKPTAQPKPVTLPVPDPPVEAVSTPPEPEPEPQPQPQPEPVATPATKLPTEELSVPKPAAKPQRKPPEPASVPQPTAGRLSIPEFGVGTGIEQRRLVGGGDRFVEGTQVWFWTRVVGGKPGETIRHVWKHEGHGSSWVPLTLGAEHWRTHSRKTLWEGSAGRWAVEAVDGDGRVLARWEFVCVPQTPSRTL